MKLVSVILKNFRGFSGNHEIPLSDISVIVGKNDIGKSTILEAIDILLNGGTVKFDKEDICKNSDNSGECIIGGKFINMPSDLVIDETATTSLMDEHLLIEDDTLFLFYRTANTASLKPFIGTHFPSNPQYQNILDKKLTDLKKIAEDLNIDRNNIPYNASSKASIRKAIREHIATNIPGGLVLAPTNIAIGEKEDGKAIFEKLLKYLPSYSLFQSDRKNEDQDKEAQDPLKAATKEILGTLEAELNKIETDVKEHVKKIAEKTIEKLKEMNPELADILEPEFTKSPDWSSVFRYSLKTNDDIPLNKRGSGVRRLILLNFFRAKAEKSLENEFSQQNRKSKDIIYAFEEPETSQHPDHQKMLIESFIELSKKENTQILLTTHSPSIAKLLPEDSLIFLKRDIDGIKIQTKEVGILREIATILGILPNIEIENPSQVKVVICVEGKNDIEFLRNVNLMVADLKEIVDLNDPRVLILPLGGSSLQYWVNLDYLGRMNLNQIHIYDSDRGHPEKANQYQKYIDKINEKGGKNFATATNKREFENYIHPKIIFDEFGYDLNLLDWDTSDIAEEIAKRNLDASESTKNWDELDDEAKKKRKSRIKNRLNETCSKKITKEFLVSLNAYEEIASWLSKAKEFLE